MNSREETTIRTARKEDADRCCEIAVSAWQAIHDVMRADLGEECYALDKTGWQEEKAAQVRKAFQIPRATVIVTEVDGRVAGFASFFLNEAGTVGTVGNNGVDPAYQGMGIGQTQIQYILDEMRYRKVRYAKVVTGLDPGHAPALHMYEKLGFVQKRRSVTLYREL